MPELDEVLLAGLSARLQTIRKLKGLSQDDLVARSAVSRANITAIEQKRHANVRLTTLSQLAEALGVDVLDLLLERPESDWSPDASAPLARLVANVKSFRATRGLSQEKLSVKANRFRTYVGRLEHGKASPQLCALLDLAGALEVSIVDLLRPNEASE